LNSSTNDMSSLVSAGGTVYLGFGDSAGNRPVLLALDTLPAPPGITPSASQLVNLKADTMPGIGKSAPVSLIDAMISFNGRLYVARNTTAGPHLWVCSPGSDLACDPGDWSLLAANDARDQQLTQFDDPGVSAVSLLATTSTHLYVGFDGSAGLTLFRSLSPG